MRHFIRRFRGATVLLALILSVLHAAAIEGLKLTVVGTNAVLSWPSAVGETYIVQWRQSFDTNHPWTSLSTNLPAATGTNWTSYAHTNGVTYPPIGQHGYTNGGGGSPPSPMMMMMNGGGAPPPLPEFPPVPWDSSTWTVPETSGLSLLGGEVQPMDGGGGGGSETNYTTAFYRVVREGVSIFGMENSPVVSDLIQVGVEVGLNFGELESVLLTDDGASLFEMSVPLEAPFSEMMIPLHTGRMTNGLHTLIAKAFLSDPSQTNPAAVSGTLTLESPPKDIVVSNAVSFP